MTTNEFNVRIGRNYKIVLAIVLPCLLIVPFIFILRGYGPLEEWSVWVIIFVFLAILMSLCLWLVLHLYPKAAISFRQNGMTIQFQKQVFYRRANISVNFSEIISFTNHQLGGDEYYMVKTKNPKRKFQLSPVSDSVNDLLAFEQAMLQIAEKLERNASVPAGFSQRNLFL